MPRQKRTSFWCFYSSSIFIISRFPFLKLTLLSVSLWENTFDVNRKHGVFFSNRQLEDVFFALQSMQSNIEFMVLREHSGIGGIDNHIREHIVEPGGCCPQTFCPIFGLSTVCLFFFVILTLDQVDFFLGTVEYLHEVLEVSEVVLDQALAVESQSALQQLLDLQQFL